MSELPTWSDLTERQRITLENIASSFGIMVDDAHERTDTGLILPDEREAYGIALEMFTLSRAILGGKYV